MLVQSRKQFYMGSHKITHSCSHNKLWLQLCVILCDTIKITSCSEQTIFHNNHKHYCSDYIYQQMVLSYKFTLLYSCSPLPPSLLQRTLVYEQRDISVESLDQKLAMTGHRKVIGTLAHFIF